MLRESLKSTIFSKVGSLLSRNAFQRMKRRLDYSEYGGAPLLGVKGACIVSHGSSNANAIKNALRVAAEYARAGITRKIEHELAHVHNSAALTQTT
jgi:glycerol-3-phosphate acyltransferase PlsX